MKPTQDKPTLEELLASKKLDAPKDAFWENFDKQVHGKAMASNSLRNRAQVFLQPALLFSLFFSFYFFMAEDSSISKNLSVIESSSQFDDKPSVFVEELDHLNNDKLLIEELENSVFDVVSVDENSELLNPPVNSSFVENSIRFGDPKTSDTFLTSVIEYSQDELSTRYIF